MPDPQASAARTRRSGPERELVSFDGGTVVRLVSGDPAGPGAVVVPMLRARVAVTDERVVAGEGTQEWSWLLDELDAVHHGADGWSILAVPGIADLGVAVAPSDAAALRRAIDWARDQRRPRPALTGAGTAWDPLPSAPSEARVPASAPSRDEDTVLDLTVGPHAHPDAETRPDPPPVVTVADLGGGDGRPASEPLLPPPPPPPPMASEVAVEDLPPGSEATAGRRRRLARRRPRRRGGSEVARPPTQAGPAPLASLDAREVSAWFGTHHVLDRVSLHMAPGQVTALIGPSGCGKSTFLRILNRMHEMVASASLSGEVLLDGVDVYDPQRKLIDARRQIGMVFQKPNPFPAMSIYDNVVASYRLTGTKVSKQEKDDVVEACLAKAGLWNEVRDRLRAPGGGLSGGQQQRLCIARALAIRPRVLLMDEPCSALDPTSTRRIEETIMELGSEVTIVIVTHNMQQAARVSDQCAFFLAEQGTPGVVVEHGPTEAMFHSPQDERTSDYVNGRFG